MGIEMKESPGAILAPKMLQMDKAPPPPPGLLRARTLGNFTLLGRVKAGKRLPFAINNEEFAITSETWIIGKLAPGVFAEVKGVIYTGFGKYATKVTVKG